MLMPGWQDMQKPTDLWIYLFFQTERQYALSSGANLAQV